MVPTHECPPCPSPGGSHCHHKDNFAACGAAAEQLQFIASLYSDKLPLIPLNILCCNLQNPEDHPFSLASLMLKVYFKNCSRFASKQQHCFHSYKCSVQLPFTPQPKLWLNQHLFCFIEGTWFTSWSHYYYFSLSPPPCFCSSDRAKLKSLDTNPGKGGWKCGVNAVYFCSKQKANGTLLV